MTQPMTAIVLAFSLLCATAGAETADQDNFDKLNEAFYKAIADQDWEVAKSLFNEHLNEHQGDRKVQQSILKRWNLQNWKVEMYIAKRSDEGKLPANETVRYTKTYSVDDLPIYNHQGKGEGMKIDILVAYFLAKVGEEKWHNGKTSVSPYQQNFSLVISTTQEVHNHISDALDELRRK